jgi:alpha-D-xyloside xylohydrolase
VKSRNGSSFYPVQEIGSLFKEVDGELRFPAKAASTEMFIGLTFYAEGYIRYRIEAAGEQRWKHTFAHTEKLKPIKAVVVEESTGFVITAGPFVAHLHTEPYSLSIKDQQGNMMLEEFASDVNARSEWISAPTGYTASSDQQLSTRFNFAYSADTSYYGTGERFPSLRQNNRRITLWNDNPYGSGTDRAYKNIPLVLTDRGYALLLHETARSTWDFGSTSTFSCSIEVDQQGIDLFIIVAPTMAEQLKAYSELTCKAPMPPRWSFGVWVSPFGNYLDAGSTWQQDEFLQFIASLDEHEMPCDVIHLDPYWMGKTKKLCDFAWDPVDYPDPKLFIDTLAKRGLRLCLWEHPYIEKGSELYEEGKRNGYFIKKADGSVYDYHIVIVPAERRTAEQTEYAEDFYALGSAVDFSNPAAVEWYKSLHRPLIEMGTATFKTDFGEVTPYDAHFFNGMSGREMHNLYAYLYNKTVWEVEQEYTDTPFLWGRSGYAGSQAFPVQWSGDPVSDLRSLRTTIISGLNYGLSGIPFWSFDIGGFKGLPDSEPYVRWAQVGLLLSHARFHGTASRMPWNFSDEAQEIVMEAVRLRYRLLPYILAIAKQATETGLPVIRAMSLAFEGDSGSRSVETQFMLGSSLLVVPVLKEGGEVEIYLPEGTWYDYYTGEVQSGPKTYRTVSPLDKIPLFVREGAIIPTTEVANRVRQWDPQLSVHLYGRATNTVVIPEENQTMDTSITSETKGSVLGIEVVSKTRNWTFICHGWTKLPKEVLLNGKPCKAFLNEESNTLHIALVNEGTFKLSIQED